MKLLLDNEAVTTLEELLQTNAEADVVPLEEEEIERVKKLAPGESCYVGFTEIKRIE